MTLRLRRILYLSVFLLFFIVAPALIFYAAGYRYDVARHRITTVGALYIKSYPSGSPITIDGERTNKRTPNRVLNILPGTHTVSVVREGYHPWEKKLEVLPGQTTFARDIVLFKERQDRTALSDGGRQFIANEAKTAYAYIGNDGMLHLTSLISESDYRIETDPLPDALLAISPDADILLFSTDTRWYLVDVNTEKTTMTEVRSSQPGRIVWDPFAKDIVWTMSDGRLLSIQLTTGVTRSRIDSIHDFMFAGPYLFTFGKEDGALVVSRFSRETLDRSWRKTLDSNTDDFRFAEPLTNGILTLSNGQSIWLFDTDTGDTQHIDAKFFDWHDTRLLYASDFEVSMYDHSTRESQLIDRSSERIDALLWHPSGSYFLWRKGGILYIVEIDSRDVRNTVTIGLTPTSTFETVFNKKGSKLFILEPTQHQSLTIQ